VSSEKSAADASHTRYCCTQVCVCRNPCPPCVADAAVVGDSRRRLHDAAAFCQQPVRPAQHTPVSHAHGEGAAEGDKHAAQGCWLGMGWWWWWWLSVSTSHDPHMFITPYMAVAPERGCSLRYASDCLHVMCMWCACGVGMFHECCIRGARATLYWLAAGCSVLSQDISLNCRRSRAHTHMHAHPAYMHTCINTAPTRHPSTALADVSAVARPSTGACSGGVSRRYQG
jgi:hypothetical protein